MSYDQVPRARLSSVQLAVRRYWFFGLLGLLVFLVVLSIVRLNNASSDKPVIPEIDLPVAQGVATSAAYDFLDARNTNVPVTLDVPANFAEINTPFDYSTLAWTGFVARDIPGTASLPSIPIETHSFDVLSSSGERYVLDVTVDVTGTPALAQLPSMAPKTYSEGVGPGVKYSVQSTNPETIPDNIASQVQLWAQAYGSGNGDQLAVLSGDSRPEASYVGLSASEGFVLASPQFVGYVVSTVDNSALVTVQVEFSRPEVSADPDNNIAGVAPKKLTLSFDLLVNSTDIARPTIEAWGPPGSGFNLVSYQNAVIVG